MQYFIDYVAELINESRKNVTLEKLQLKSCRHGCHIPNHRPELMNARGTLLTSEPLLLPRLYLFFKTSVSIFPE